jgi:hypothetical protein
MTGCGTYRMPPLELSKEDEIKTTVKKVISIKSQLEETEKIVELNRPNQQDAFNVLEYYKDKYTFSYNKLLSLLDFDEQKINKLLKK